MSIQRTNDRFSKVGGDASRGSHSVDAPVTGVQGDVDCSGPGVILQVFKVLLASLRHSACKHGQSSTAGKSVVSANALLERVAWVREGVMGSSRLGDEN